MQYVKSIVHMEAVPAGSPQRDGQSMSGCMTLPIDETANENQLKPVSSIGIPVNAHFTLLPFRHDGPAGANDLVSGQHRQALKILLDTFPCFDERIGAVHLRDSTADRNDLQFNSWQLAGLFFAGKCVSAALLCSIPRSNRQSMLMVSTAGLRPKHQPSPQCRQL